MVPARIWVPIPVWLSFPGLRHRGCGRVWAECGAEGPLSCMGLTLPTVRPLHPQPGGRAGFSGRVAAGMAGPQAAVQGLTAAEPAPGFSRGKLSADPSLALSPAEGPVHPSPRPTQSSLSPWAPLHEGEL